MDIQHTNNSIENLICCLKIMNKKDKLEYKKCFKLFKLILYL